MSNHQTTDRLTVKVDYPGTKETRFVTLGQLRADLKGEDPEYIKKFFDLLTSTGSVYGRIIKYTIVTNEPGN